MKKCPYCAESIQDEAIVCRYCGRDLRKSELEPEPEHLAQSQPGARATPGSSSSKTGLFVLGALAVVLLLAFLLFGDWSGVENRKAVEICQKQVTMRLKAPATAEFPPIGRITVERKNQLFSIYSYVDSENSFGAKIRSWYTCSLIHNQSTGAFLLSSLEFEEN